MSESLAAAVLQEHARAQALLGRYGKHSLSSQAAVANAQFWFAEDGEGFVAYVYALRTRVAIGPPVGPTDRLPALVHSFVAAAKQTGHATCFFGMDPQLAQLAGLRWLACGEEPLWELGRWQDLQRRAGCQRQLRRALRAGVQVALLPNPGPDGARPALHAGEQAGEAAEACVDFSQLAALLARWQTGQGLPPLGFVARASLRTEVPGAVRLVARLHGQPVALAVALPNAADGTWLVEQLIRTPGAPNGTVELLIDRTLSLLAERAPKAWASLGVVALAGPVRWPLRLARAVGRKLYPFAGLAAFRRKLCPEQVAPLTLAYPRVTSPLRALLALLVAFTDGRPLAFLGRTLLLGSPTVLGLMALCLLPWTAALAAAPAAWFAGPATQRAWVGFDLGLLLALGWLAYRPSAPLARGLAIVVSLDTCLTAVEAAWVPGPDGSWWWRWGVRLVAVAAPALSARVLWGCARRLARSRGAGGIKPARQAPTDPRR